MFLKDKVLSAVLVSVQIFINLICSNTTNKDLSMDSSLGPLVAYNIYLQIVSLELRV